jgi:hypothetical protein
MINKYELTSPGNSNFEGFDYLLEWFFFSFCAFAYWGIAIAGKGQQI